MANQSTSAISLRAYNREIEGMIEGGHIDEAIAHCRHILQTFPKHVASYRLLGKAYLEAQRYADAADIFQRVLSAIPDDFVSHAGMSIVREDESNLDAAIWHMERAYEAQPYNNAIQGELRRLYGLRDKSSPPKVRLSRGALARMYTKGDLYQQAIGELRAALAEDPQRPDLQCLLARAYFQAGQRVEAVETCSNLLKKLPYCLEANRILSAILPETERAADTPIYRQRVAVLDPYFARAPEKAITSDGISDNAIGLERLVWKPGQALGPESSQPAWAASLGVTIQDQAETMPDWMIPGGEAPEAPGQARPGTGPLAGRGVRPTTGGLLQKKPTSDPSAEPNAPIGKSPGGVIPEDDTLFPAEAAEEIPDWMKTAGWELSAQTDSKAAPQGASPFTFEAEENPATTRDAPAAELAPGELPDWMRELAPPEVNELSAPQDETALPWLQEMQPGSSDTVINWLEQEKKTSPAEQPAEPAEVLPDWLMGDGGSPQPGLAQEAAGAAELPDWLKALDTPSEPGPEQAAIQTPAGETGVQSQIPDWLMTDEATESAATENAAPPGWLAAVAPAAAVSAELPDWLKEDAPQPPAEPSPEAAESGSPAPGNLTDWLRAIAEEPDGQSAVPAAGEMPDWLAGLPSAEPTPPTTGVTDWLGKVGPALPSSEAQAMPDWLTPTSPLSASPTALEPAADEALPDWLREDSAQAAATPSEGFPDWLKELPDAPTAPQQMEETPPASQLEALPLEATELPEWLVETAPFPEGQPYAAPTTADELPDWLQSLEAEPPTTVESLPAAVPAEGLPDWLKAPPAPQTPGEAPQSKLTGMSKPSLEDQDNALAWLESLAAKQGVPEEEMITRPETRLDAPPDWVTKESAGATPLEASLPDWASGNEGESLEAVETPLDSNLAGAEPAEALPDWLKAEALKPTPTQSAAPAGLPSLEDQDAALAWLESLAAKQGAPEEEMITRPETRFEAPPSWVTEEAAKAETEYLPTPPEAAVPTETLQDGLEPAVVEAAETAPQAPQVPAVPGLPSLEDQDAALAWLESLAAKQGAPEEEMITRPETRFEAPPEWVVEEAARGETPTPPLPQLEELDETAEAVQTWQPEPEEIEPVVTPPIEQGPSTGLPSLEDQDAALAWLESLAAKQGAPEEELLTRPDERISAPPEWVVEEASAPAMQAAPEAESALPAWLTEVEAEIPAEAAPTVEAAPAVESALPAWLTEVEAEIPAEAAPAVEAAPAAESALPAWLTEVEAEMPDTAAAEIAPEPAEEAPIPAWISGPTPSAEAVEESVWPEEVQAALPQWRDQAAQAPISKLDLNTASMVALEALPGIGFVLAQSIIAYRDTYGPFSRVEDLEYISGIGPAMVEELRPYLSVTAEVPAPPAVTPENEALTLARNALQKGDLSAAVEQYEALLTQGHPAGVVILDVQDALYRFPVDIALWQVLGDAFLRNNQLQDALDAYTKAEELLR